MSLKSEIKSVIVQLGINETELVFDIKLRKITFNSIEWKRKSNQIILHKFVKDEDHEYNFDELPKEIKKEIHNLMINLSVTC
jgi:hypothetical protein